MHTLLRELSRHICTTDLLTNLVWSAMNYNDTRYNRNTGTTAGIWTTALVAIHMGLPEAEECLNSLKKKLKIVKLPSTLPSKAGNLEYKQVLKEKKQPSSMRLLTAKRRNSMLLFMQSSQKIVYIATCHFCHVPNGFFSIYRHVHLVLNWSWNCWCLLPRVGPAQMWLCAWHKIRQGEKTSRKACLPCHS